MALFQKLEEEGLVRLGFYGFIYGAETPQFVGCCNCCGDCCGILRGNTDLDLEEGVQRSNYRAVIDYDHCVQCNNCINLCQVKAVTEDSEGLPELNRDKCIGCGACVIGCPGDAIELVPVSQEEWYDVPSSFEEWEERRLANLESK